MKPSKFSERGAVSVPSEDGVGRQEGKSGRKQQTGRITQKEQEEKNKICKRRTRVSSASPATRERRKPKLKEFTLIRLQSTRSGVGRKGVPKKLNQTKGSHIRPG